MFANDDAINVSIVIQNLPQQNQVPIDLTSSNAKYKGNENHNLVTPTSDNK